MRLPGGFLFLVLVSAAAAQVADGIVSDASRTVSVAPDEAGFLVVVAAPLDTTQQQVLQVFRDAGAQNVNVLAVAAGQNPSAYPPPQESQFFYQISFTVAPAAAKEYAKRLDALRAALPEGIAGLQYSVSFNASQAAVESARQAILPQLLQDAKARAQSVATASGLRLGAVLGVSASFYSIGNPASSQLASGFFYSNSSATNTTGSQYSFFVNVKFAAQ